LKEDSNEKVKHFGTIIVFNLSRRWWRGSLSQCNAHIA